MTEGMKYVGSHVLIHTCIRDVRAKIGLKVIYLTLLNVFVCFFDLILCSNRTSEHVTTVFRKVSSDDSV